MLLLKIEVGETNYSRKLLKPRERNRLQTKAEFRVSDGHHQRKTFLQLINS